MRKEFLLQKDGNGRFIRMGSFRIEKASSKLRQRQLADLQAGMPGFDLESAERTACGRSAHPQARSSG